MSSSRLGSPDFVVFYLFLPQDLDIFLPIMLEFHKAGVPIRAHLGGSLHRRSPRVLGLLRQAQIPFSLDYRPYLMALGFSKYLFSWPIYWGRGALFCIETSIPAHNLGRRMAIQAKRLGLKIYTVQHGLENIGINYSDSDYPSGSVSFVSDRIFIWSDQNMATWAASKSRFAAVGRPSLPKAQNGCPLPDVDSIIKRVGIFENLHWNRYSESYRTRFLKSVREMCKTFPAVAFYLKPHSMSFWTKQELALLAGPQNLIFLDPKNRQWRDFTAPMLIPQLDAVITTPSTVALDAAQIGVPVAIAANDLPLEAFSPLPLLRREKDWSDFVARVIADRNFGRSERQRFKELNLISESSEARILQLVCEDFSDKQNL